ncbi:hypothetical protein AB0F20_09995 [Streptomyces goshikiensis]|uniref:hypothetical protein n=1 Tax=Streptomyces goshikiensis TaxID=1942 RepID=UPI00340D576F
MSENDGGRPSQAAARVRCGRVSSRAHTLRRSSVASVPQDGPRHGRGVGQKAAIGLCGRV